MKTKVSDRFAVMAIDPGGTTGVAGAVFRRRDARPKNPKVTGGTPRVLKRRKEAFTDEVKGTPTEQTVELWSRYLTWSSDCMLMHGIASRDCWLVIEDFIQRPGSTTASRDQQASIRIISGVEVLREWSSRNWQGEAGPISQVDLYGHLRMVQPSHHKTYATPARRRSWGLWVVGSEHKRDANSIMAYGVGKILGGDWA